MSNFRTEIERWAVDLANTGWHVQGDIPQNIGLALLKNKSCLRLAGRKTETLQEVEYFLVISPELLNNEPKKMLSMPPMLSLTTAAEWKR